LHLSNFFELKRTLVYIHLQLQLTRKVLDIQFIVYVLFYKYSSSKCKQRICLHYGLDMVLTGEWMQSACCFCKNVIPGKACIFTCARAVHDIFCHDCRCHDVTCSISVISRSKYCIFNQKIFGEVRIFFRVGAGNEYLIYIRRSQAHQMTVYRHTDSTAKNVE
jgi:hypothetical protein